MNKDYLPFYDSLTQDEKDFWLECSKESLIDHFIANVRNGEELVSRIEKANDFINRYLSLNLEAFDTNSLLIKLREILYGDKDE